MNVFIGIGLFVTAVALYSPLLELLFLLASWLTQDPELSTHWNQQWPPIDDDEFIRRCRPGVDRETALRVRKIVSHQLGIPYTQIYPEQSFVDDLHCC